MTEKELAQHLYEKYMDRLRWAESRRDDPDADIADVRYWVGYIDGLKAVMKIMEV